MSPQYTLRELQLLARGNTPTEISLSLTFADSHEDVLAALEKAIDWIILEFSRTPKERQNRSEDGLSIDLVTALRAMGFQASHDTTVGGHCDVVVDGLKDFLWLGEAKKHSSYEWLMAGFSQLDKRYATANVGQDCGGIIIYCEGQRVDRVMDAWERKLKLDRSDVTVTKSANWPLYRWSEHVHRRTGLPYKVRHTPVSLYWNPEGEEPN